jgi:hypothetical protein
MKRRSFLVSPFVEQPESVGVFSPEMSVKSGVDRRAGARR